MLFIAIPLTPKLGIKIKSPIIPKIACIIKNIYTFFALFIVTNITLKKVGIIQIIKAIVSSSKYCLIATILTSLGFIALIREVP